MSLATIFRDPEELIAEAHWNGNHSLLADSTSVPAVVGCLRVGNQKEKHRERFRFTSVPT